MAINEPTDTIKIKRVTDDVYIVEWKFANGWSHVQKCANEHEARVWVDGFRTGLKAVSHMIGNGVHFTGNVENVNA